MLNTSKNRKRALSVKRAATSRVNKLLLLLTGKVKFHLCGFGIYFLFFQPKGCLSYPESSRSFSAFSRRWLLFIFFMAWLGFSLFLIPWAVSKYAENSRLDRLNSFESEEVHYLGAVLEGERSSRSRSCSEETTHNWTRHCYCNCCITLVRTCQLLSVRQ